MFITLENLNLTENELDELLNFIYEAEDHPEKEMYFKFIGEATLDEKLGLTQKLMIEAEAEAKGKGVGHLKKGAMSMAGQVGGLGVFWVAYRVIKAMKDKCSRKCSVIGTNTFMRQKCMADCQAQEAAKSLAAASKVSCKGDSACESKKKELIAKWKKKAAEAADKKKRYAEKHKKLAYTV